MRERSYLLAAVLVLAAFGCHRRKEPALTLVYAVDVNAADGASGADATSIVKATRSAIEQRLEPIYRRDVSVTTRGDEVIVTLPQQSPEGLAEIETIIETPNRLAVQRVDEQPKAFAQLDSSRLVGLLEEGISVMTERVPDGAGPDGEPVLVTGTFARVALGPPKHRGETMVQCRQRLEKWTRTLSVPADREFAFERVRDAAGSDLGWRTIYLVRPRALTNDDIADVRRFVNTTDGHSQYYAKVTFTDEGAKRFAALTGGPHLMHRVAIAVDGVIVSAALVRAEIEGTDVSLSMGANSPETQKIDAELVEMYLRQVPLPAPVHRVTVN